MEIAEKRTKEQVLMVLQFEGYTNVRDRNSEIIEVEHPRREIIIVLYLNESNLVIALSSKVTHSKISDPELDEEEQVLCNLIAA